MIEIKNVSKIFKGEKSDVHNVIFADIDFIQDAPIGGTVGIFSGEREKITQAIQYLIEKNVFVEVIKDERSA